MRDTPKRQTRDEDGSSTSADDVFTDDVVLSPAVWSDGRHTRRFPGGLYGDSSRLSQREEHSHVHPKAVRLFLVVHHLQPTFLFYISSSFRFNLTSSQTGSLWHSILRLLKAQRECFFFKVMRSNDRLAKNSSMYGTVELTSFSVTRIVTWNHDLIGCIVFVLISVVFSRNDRFTWIKMRR